MEFEEALSPGRDPRGMIVRGGTGSLRLALLFASAAVALTLLVTPFAERQTRVADLSGAGNVGIDNTFTGSVGPVDTSGRNGGRYTIHRSVLQNSPSSVCIIYANGVRSGDC